MTRATVTDAVCVEEELHAATLVTSCVVLSEKVAVAVNCWLTSSAMDAGLGEITSEVAVAEVTVSAAVAETLPEVAVIVVVPWVRPVASPLPGEVFPMVANAVFDELQVTLPVRV